MAREQAVAADRHAIALEDHQLLTMIATERARQSRESYDLRETEAQLDRALHFAQLSGNAKLRIVPLYESGAMAWENGDLDQAREKFKAAQEASYQLNEGEGQSLASNGLGVIAMCQGRSAEARRYFDEAMKSAREAGMMELLVNPRTNLAELHHCMGNFRRGFKLVNEAITEAREVRHRHGLGVSLRYRAILLGDVGHFPDAEENARTAIQIQKELGNQQEELAAIVCLLRSLIPTEQWSAADLEIERGLDLAEQYDAEGYLPILLSWKALLLQKLGRGEEAREFLGEATIEEGRAWRHQEARCHLNIARSWWALNDLDRAHQEASAALKISDASGYRFYSMRARQILSAVAPSEDDQMRHKRIAESLAKSLSANLSQQDAESFMARNVSPT